MEKKTKVSVSKRNFFLAAEIFFLLYRGGRLGYSIKVPLFSTVQTKFVSYDKYINRKMVTRNLEIKERTTSANRQGDLKIRVHLRAIHQQG